MTSPVSAIEAIEKAMEGVTHGDWYLAGKLTIRHTSPVGGTDGWIGKVNWRNGEANAAYIAACNPVAMREVVALVHNAEEEKQRLLHDLSGERSLVAALTEANAVLARKAEALQRENAGLREALKPFADVADQLPIRCLVVPDQKPLWGYDGIELSYGDFRRARALLGGSENAGN